MAHHRLAVAAALVAGLLAALRPARAYEPTWESISTRPVPTWFRTMKFGIFIHWGVYAVPAWRCGRVDEWTDWYRWELEGEDPANNECLRNWHEAQYGPGAPYTVFADMFKAELYNATEWARLIDLSGANYVVFTTKHHDGWANWPTAAAPGWNSGDVGPRRDIVGELAEALRALARPIRLGLYHSLVEWFNPLYLADREANTTTYPDQVLQPMLRDIVERYKPAVVWADGDWYASDAYWKSKEFLAWLFTDSPVADEVVVNDRWASGGQCGNACVRTVEQGDGQFYPYDWEECRTIGTSWGYHRGLLYEDYQQPAELIGRLVRVAAYNGNLLLNIGPRADGLIPFVFQERLRAIGDWLRVHGAAIFGTTYWPVAQRENDTAVYYTRALDAPVVNAILLDWPADNRLRLRAAVPSDDTVATLLGHAPSLTWQYANDTGLEVALPALTPLTLPSPYAWVVTLTHLANLGEVPR